MDVDPKEKSAPIREEVEKKVEQEEKTTGRKRLYWVSGIGCLVVLLVVLVAGIVGGMYIFGSGKAPVPPRYLLDGLFVDGQGFCPVLWVYAPGAKGYQFKGEDAQRVPANSQFKSVPFEWGDTVHLALFYGDKERRVKTFVLPQKDKLMAIKGQGVQLGTNLTAFLEQQNARVIGEMAQLDVVHSEKPGWPVLKIADPLSEDYFVGAEGDLLTNDMILVDVKWGSTYIYTVTNKLTGMSIERTLELPPKYDEVVIREFLGDDLEKWADWETYLAPQHAAFVQKAQQRVPAAYLAVPSCGARPEIGFEAYDNSVWEVNVPEELKWGTAVTISMKNMYTKEVVDQTIGLVLDDPELWLPEGSVQVVYEKVFPLLDGKAKSEVERLLAIRQKQAMAVDYLKGSELDSEILYNIYLVLGKWRDIPPPVIAAFTNCMNSCLLATTLPDDPLDDGSRLNDIAIFKNARDLYLNHMHANDVCSYTAPPLIGDWQLGQGYVTPQWEELNVDNQYVDIELTTSAMHAMDWSKAYEMELIKNISEMVNKYILEQDADFKVRCLEAEKQKLIMTALHDVHLYDCEQGSLTDLSSALLQAWELVRQDAYLKETLTDSLTLKSVRGLRGGADYTPGKGDVMAFLNEFPDDLYDALTTEQKKRIATQLSQWLGMYNPGVWAEWNKWPGRNPGMELAADALLILAEEQVHEFEQATERSVKKEYVNAAEDYLQAFASVIKIMPDSLDKKHIEERALILRGAWK